MPDLPLWFGLACVVLGSAGGAWAASWLVHRLRADKVLAAVEADRDRLIDAAGGMLAACHDPYRNLDRAVADLEKAVAGRWGT